jgi:hypothetical protein
MYELNCQLTFENGLLSMPFQSLLFSIVACHNSLLTELDYCSMQDKMFDFQWTVVEIVVGMISENKESFQDRSVQAMHNLYVRFQVSC